MNVELIIDSTKELPKCAVLALEKVSLNRLQNQLEKCNLIKRRTCWDALCVYGREKCLKKKVELILHQTWESADDWFY